jgi:hypothetical protein
MDILTGKKSKNNLMIENSTLRVGGNTLKVWYGEFLNNIGEFFTNKGTNLVVNNKPKIVTNPTVKLTIRVNGLINLPVGLVTIFGLLFTTKLVPLLVKNSPMLFRNSPYQTFKVLPPTRNVEFSIIRLFFDFFPVKISICC